MVENEKIEIHLTERPLLVQSCYDFVAGPDTGGIDIFVGTSRNHTRGRVVLRLEFEAYEPMALREMRKIAEDIISRFDLKKVSLVHRLGVVLPGEIAVIIAVSAFHRAAAFEGCRYAIDHLKETVPIWKKEVFEDGEVWVAAHP